MHLIRLHTFFQPGFSCHMTIAGAYHIQVHLLLALADNHRPEQLRYNIPEQWIDRSLGRPFFYLAMTDDCFQPR